MKTEQDIQKAIYDNAMDYISKIESTMSDSRLSKNDKFFIMAEMKLAINNVLNIAFNNQFFHNYLDKGNVEKGIMPENYIKPMCN